MAVFVPMATAAELWALRGLMLVVAVLFPVAMAAQQMLQLRWPLRLFTVAAVAMVVTYAALRVRARRVIRRRRFLVCPSCLYTIEGLAEFGECPECGVRFAREKAKATWRQSYELADS